MLTRGGVTHAYRPAQIAHFVRPGFAKVEVHKGIPQVWPIVRPVSAPQPAGAPYYLDFPYRPNVLTFGGTQSLRLPRPNNEMDPSNKASWQRPYLFS